MFFEIKSIFTLERTEKTLFHTFYVYIALGNLVRCPRLGDAKQLETPMSGLENLQFYSSHF